MKREHKPNAPFAEKEDHIVDIPENRVKYFGTTGKMLLPGTVSVAALLREIPVGKLTTISQMGKALAVRNSVQGTCPITLKKALLAAYCEEGDSLPWWRTVGTGGRPLTSFPGGIDGQAARLIGEGHRIAGDGEMKQAVEGYREFLHDFNK